MVYFSSLSRLLSFLKTEQLKPMKNWSKRYRKDRDCRPNRHIKKIKSEIRLILNLISGNEIVEMLKDILNKNELDDLTLPKYKSSLRNLTEYYGKSKFKERHNIIRPFKVAGFKYSEIKRLGYGVSRKLWLSCLYKGSRNKGGGTSIPEYLQSSINSYLKENSSVASNRLVKNKNPSNHNYQKEIQARYLSDTRAKLYNEFNYKNDLSRSTFYKYSNINGQYKSPHRMTDLCEYCEKGKVLKQRIGNNIKNEQFDIASFYDLSKIEGFCFEKASNIRAEISSATDEIKRVELQVDYNKFKDCIIDIKDYQQIIFHQNVARAQRQAYINDHKNINDVNKNKILIEIDFKQKIVIGMSPRQVGREYFEQQVRSCLGFGIYYAKLDEVGEINFNIISSNLDQGGSAAVRGFRILRNQEFFKKIDKNDYIVWADCGPHFRTQKFIGYLLIELAKLKIRVSLNFFGEHHGKNNRDTHFSNISRFVKSESLVRQLTSSQDIVDAIHKRQLIANQNQKNEAKHKLTICTVLDSKLDYKDKEEFPENMNLKIRNVESFYNYRTIGDDLKLVSSGLSNETGFSELNEVSRCKSGNVEYLVGEETIIHKEEVNLQNLYLKKCRMQGFISKTMDHPFIDFTKNTSSLTATNNAMTNDVNLASTLTPDMDKFHEFFGQPITIKTKIVENVQLPKFCKETPLKLACKKCLQICSYSIEMLLDPSVHLSQDDIRDELKFHGHPKTRVMDKLIICGKTKLIGAKSHEQARELADHYIFAHNNIEPIFL